MQLCIELYRSLTWKASQISLGTADPLLTAWRVVTFNTTVKWLLGTMLSSCISSTHLSTLTKLQSITKTHFCQHLNSKSKVQWDLNGHVYSVSKSIFSGRIGRSAHGSQTFFLLTRNLDQRLFTQGWVSALSRQVAQLLLVLARTQTSWAAAAMYRFRLSLRRSASSLVSPKSKRD